MIDGAYDPLRDLRHWPTPMSKYGKNPYGDNLFRLVWAPSARYLIYGTWPDGSTKASWNRKYPQAGDNWVLDKWLSAYEFAKCTPEVWNETMTILGPYPDRGEYDLAHVFDMVNPDDSNLEKLIIWINEGKNRSFFENRVACQANADAEELDRKRLRLDIIRDSLPAFGAAPMVGHGGGRGTKTAPILKSAEELGLPTGGGQSRVMPTRKQEFEVPLSVE